MLSLMQTCEIRHHKERKTLKYMKLQEHVMYIQNHIFMRLMCVVFEARFVLSNFNKSKR